MHWHLEAGSQERQTPKEYRTLYVIVWSCSVLTASHLFFEKHEVV